MKMRVRKKINWMKRMVAAGMAVCMVLTTPALALAGAGEGTETQTISEEAAGESILDTGTGSVDAGESEDRRKVQSRAGQKTGQTARKRQKRTARQELRKKTARQKRLDLRNKAARQKKQDQQKRKHSRTAKILSRATAR